MAGLTTTGITIDDVETIIAALVAEEVANIDADLNTEADSVLGQLNGIFAAKVAECYELLEEIYHSAYPDTASGQSLSYLCELFGITRLTKTYAELDVVLAGTAGQTVSAGVQAYPGDDSDSIFELDADVLLDGGGAGTGTMTAVTAGSGPTAIDNEAMVIVVSDPYLTSLTTASSDAFTPGRDEETDTELRQRRELTLAQAGSSTVDAIRADVLSVTGVDTCTVFENPTGVTDANGVPPYAIEVLVYNSVAPSYDEDAVCAQIWASKPAGTATYGTAAGAPVSVMDSAGNYHDVYYSEPTTQQLWVDITLTPASDGSYIGDDNVAAALETWATANLAVGQSVYASDIINVVADLNGVVFINPVFTFVDDNSAPSGSWSWVAGSRQLGTLSADDVTVVSS